MYEDDKNWPIKCFSCRNEFTEKIGRLKTGARINCPDCGLGFNLPTEQFVMALAEARDGRLNPWRDMIRITKTD